MQRRTKIVGVMAAGALVAVTAAACSSSGKPSTTSSTATGASTVAFNYGTTGVVNPSTTKGGTLVLGASSDVDYLDPARQYYAWTWNLERLYGRTVMTYATKAGKASTDLVPDMATGAGTVSADGLTWTYHIKSGLKFQDGTTITTKDIKYAVERTYATDVINGGPGYFQALLDDSAYTGPYKDKDPNHLGLTSITTPDDTTITFKLKSPFADFDYLMTLPQTTPVPQAADLASATGGANYNTHVIASGPYEVSTYSPGKEIDFVRNPNWSAATDSVRPALPDKITLKTDWDPVQLDAAILAGQVAVGADGTGAQQATVATVMGNAAKKKDADNASANATRYVTIQENVKPFDNIHCRLAVAYALNKVDLINARGGPVAGASIATSLLPPGVSGHTDANLLPNGSDYKGDVAKAKSELTLCGEPNGFTTVIATTNKGKGPLFATALQNALNQVGIKTTIDAVDASSYYSTEIGTPANVSKKGLGLATAGWGPDWPSGYGFFSQIVDGRQIKATGNQDYSMLNDPQVNSLLDAATKATSKTAASAIYTQIDNRVMSDAALIPYGWDRLLLLRSPKATNVYVTSAYNGQYDLVSLGASQ